MFKFFVSVTDRYHNGDSGDLFFAIEAHNEREARDKVSRMMNRGVISTGEIIGVKRLSF